MLFSCDRGIFGRRRKRLEEENGGFLGDEEAIRLRVGEDIDF